MKKIVVFLCLLVAFVLPASAQKTSAQKATAQKVPASVKYTSAEGKYSIDLPKVPTVTEQDATDADGNPIKQYVASSVGGGGMFMIGYFDYKANSFSLDRARDGMVERVKGTLISEDPIKLGTSPGRQLKILAKGPDGTELIIRARMYNTGTRAYILQFLSLKTSDSPAVEVKANKGFDTFKVTK